MTGGRAVLDTDANNEIDDQFALVHALLSPEIDLRAVYAAPFVNAHSATPEAGMRQSHDEIVRVGELMGAMPLPPALFGSTRGFSTDQPERSDAIEHLIATAFDGPEPLCVLAIGAATNVANALCSEPGLADRIVVVWLGGHALHWPHTSEFNLEQDLAASRLLLDCGVPLVRVPCLGVVSTLHTTVWEIEHFVRGRGAIGDYLSDIFGAHVADSGLARSKELWDTAALAYLLDPTWVETEIRPSPVISQSGTDAELRWSVDRRRHLIREAVAVHRDPILADFFVKLDRHASGASAHRSG
ncbi:MAG: nucleoside hydrolase [Phycicoccus sp.]